MDLHVSVRARMRTCKVEAAWFRRRSSCSVISSMASASVGRPCMSRSCTWFDQHSPSGYIIVSEATYTHSLTPGYLDGTSSGERVELEHPVTAERISPQVLGSCVTEPLDHSGLVPGCARSSMRAYAWCDIIAKSNPHTNHSPMFFVSGTNCPSFRHKCNVVRRRLRQTLYVLGRHFYRVSESFESNFPYFFGHAANDHTIVPHLLEFGTHYLQ